MQFKVTDTHLDTYWHPVPTYAATNYSTILYKAPPFHSTLIALLVIKANIHVLSTKCTYITKCMSPWTLYTCKLD